MSRLRAPALLAVSVVDLAARRFGGCRIERRDDTAINSSDHGDHRDRRERVRQCLLAAGGGSGGHRR